MIEGSEKTWRQDQRVRLQHVDTGIYLHSHDKKYTRIAGGQQEVMKRNVICLLQLMRTNANWKSASQNLCHNCFELLMTSFYTSNNLSACTGLRCQRKACRQCLVGSRRRIPPSKGNQVEFSHAAGNLLVLLCAKQVHGFWIVLVDGSTWSGDSCRCPTKWKKKKKTFWNYQGYVVLVPSSPLCFKRKKDANASFPSWWGRFGASRFGYISNKISYQIHSSFCMTSLTYASCCITLLHYYP